MSVLSIAPPTPPSFKMAEPISNSESSTSKRKAEQEEQDSNPIQNPSLSQLQKPNLPDTPTSTSSNRVSSSNDNKTNDAESPTANKKSKNSESLGEMVG